MTHVAFYAPMKAPDSPTPSGDREIARLTLLALTAAGFRPELASRLRSRDAAGDTAEQARLIALAEAEIDRLKRLWERDPPALWFTYHCYWKAPDLIGPALARHFGIPYVISEAIHSERRMAGPWADFAHRARAALDAADLLYWTTPRDLPGLCEVARPGQLRELPPFIDPGPAPPPGPGPDAAAGPRLLTVAMMREGDKLRSYTRLRETLGHLPRPWSLTIVGGGPAAAEVAALFAGLEGVTFHGQENDPARMRRLYETHDLFVWPGVGEGFGMVFLEAQAAGLPAICDNHSGPATVVPFRPLPDPADPSALAAAIAALPRDADARAATRAHVLAHHGLDAAARSLRIQLGELMT
ncbi:glycosyltransferase family 4 protein [Paroceanicella profunda]|uniref:Glycosyltransferase family 4 protein n=1 Tax=Paroceanicella profunda TaxID=2579971 RepID=A0A5B8FQD6_9RHOB|nr:glycosyltransferase [Paroceanicella profunda]QDL90826.1 glycosyltransferase family 4 protein [Paroceanicella profunda]